MTIVKMQMQDLQADIRRKGVVDSDARREEVGKKQSAVPKGRHTNREQPRDLSHG